MPVRFRCAYCMQLMSIARRKAGTVVRCPKCAGEIIVPPAELEPAPAEPGKPFEEEDFDVRLEEGSNQAEAQAQPTAAPAHEPPKPMPLGVFMPMGMLIISIGVVVMLLILMFVIGLIIGMQHPVSK